MSPLPGLGGHLLSPRSVRGWDTGCHLSTVMGHTDGSAGT